MSTIDRTLIREFFDFDLEWTPRCWWRKPLNIIVFFVSCWLWYDHTIWVGGFAAVLGFVGVHLLWTKSQQDHRRRRELRFGELASYTRAIQAGDVTRAFLRVFQRSQLDRASLRILDQRYVFEQERALLDEETLSERLGDLQNKSIRLLSRDSFNRPRLRRVSWANARAGGVHKTEVFFNPIMLICLFLTDEELVVCRVGIDSEKGDLREEVIHIMLSDIVVIRFCASRSKKLELSGEDLRQLGRDLGLRASALESFVRPGTGGSDSQGPVMALQEQVSRLAVSMTDGNELQFPIKSEVIWGKPQDALDGSSMLTEDEIAVDRMLNELNRVVRGSRPLRMA